MQGSAPTPFPGLFHFTLDTYLILLSVKQGGIKYHFLSLWYDSVYAKVFKAFNFRWQRSVSSLCDVISVRKLTFKKIHITVIYLSIYVSMYLIFIFIITTCESTCDTLLSSAAIQGDNTISVAQGGTATPGATKQLLTPDRVLKGLYIYIYTPDQSIAKTTLGRSSSFLMCNL